MFCVFCSQNVAVSKSRHRLLFYPIRKRKKNRKNLFRDVSEYGGQIIEREGISNLSIYGFPWALRYLLIFFLNYLCVFVLKSFILLRFNPCFCPQECYEVVLQTLFEKSVWCEKVCFV